MSIEEKYKQCNLNLQLDLRKEIETNHSTYDLKQLEVILTELERMYEQKGLSLNYPRYIVDSWDYQDLLGNRLMELAEMYKRLNFKATHATEK